MAAAQRCRLGIGRTYQVPRPFAHLTVFENVLVCRRAGRGGHAGSRPPTVGRLTVLRSRPISAMQANTAGRTARPLLLAASGWKWPVRCGGDPKLLLLDEVAGGLTDAEVDEFVEIVARVRRGRHHRRLDRARRARAAARRRSACLPRRREDHRRRRARPRCWTATTCARSTWAVGPELVGARVSLLEVRPKLTVPSWTASGDPGAVAARCRRDRAMLAVIGANGAGKSTLLGAIAGLLRPSAGRITFDGADMTRMADAPPGRGRASRWSPRVAGCSTSLTVEENLRSARTAGGPGRGIIDRVMDLFGWMRDRARQRGAQLSGGEQQAVAIGRALMTQSAPAAA